MEMEAICEEAGDGLRRSASIAGLGWGVVGWWVVGGGGWWVVGVWVGGLGGGGGGVLGYRRRFLLTREKNNAGSLGHVDPATALGPLLTSP